MLGRYLEIKILANLNNAVVWKVSIYPLISKSSSLLSKSLGTIQLAPSTINIIVAFMFYSFFQLSSKS